MKHKEIQEHLLLYLDGELPDEEMHQIREHLSACAVCARRRDELASVWRSESRLEKTKPSPFLWTRLQTRIREYEQTPTFVWGLRTALGRMRVRPFPVLAAIAAIFVGIYLGSSRRPDGYERVQSVGRSVVAADELGLDQFDVIPPGTLGSTLVNISNTQK